MTNVKKKYKKFLKNRISAKRLRDEIQLHKNDLLWLSEKNTIIYAVDNDVVMLFSNTEKLAWEQKYLHIFSEDEKTNSISLGTILSHHIFNTLGKETTGTALRFLIPPLDKEFGNIFEAIFTNSSKESALSETNTEFIDNLLKDNNLTDNELAQLLMDKAEDILKILFGKLHRDGEVRKLCELINENKLTSLNDIDFNQTFGLPLRFVEAYRQKKSLFEIVQASSLKQEWFNKLDNPKIDKKRRKNISGDTEAMASLLLINTRLAGSGIRLVMITGSPSLLKLANGISVNENGRSYYFSDLWLRHPRCFLGDPLILGSAINKGIDDNGNDLMALLDGFLADNNMSDENQQTEVNTVENIDKLSQEVDVFQQAWNRFSANICLGHSATMDQTRWNESNQPEVLNLVKKVREAKGGLRQLLRESWQTVFLAAIQTGFLYSWTVPERSRNLPKLIFEDFKEASSFVEDVLRQEPGTEINNLHQRIDKVRGDQSGNYTTYLIFGVLFAAQENWRIVDSLADYALLLSFEAPMTAVEAVRADSNRIITGREAYYIKAVAGRHLAINASQLKSAHDAINAAIEILKLEREVRGNILQNDMRFQFELCLINIAAAMFEKFLSDRTASFERFTSKQIQNELVNILDTCSENGHVRSDFESIRESSRILTALFIVTLTLNHSIGDTFQNDLRPYLNRFREIFEQEHKVHTTYLTRSVFSVVDWWGETDLSIKEQKKANAIDKIGSMKRIGSGIEVPYNESMTAYLIEFISI